jgi:hypothetical protein
MTKFSNATSSIADVPSRRFSSNYLIPQLNNHRTPQLKEVKLLVLVSSVGVRPSFLQRNKTLEIIYLNK